MLQRNKPDVDAPVCEDIPRRSSVLYALGRLAAETQAHKEALDGLPGRVVASLAPRLTALEAGHILHVARLTKVEERQWLIFGGMAVLTASVPVVLAYARS